VLQHHRLPHHQPPRPSDLLLLLPFIPFLAIWKQLCLEALAVLRLSQRITPRPLLRDDCLPRPRMLS
jgi:hypothetical protein